MEEMLKVLEDVRPDVDFENATNLVDGNILDSFDVISIVDGLDKKFDIDIDIDDLEPENFNTAEAMWKLVQRLQRDNKI